MKLLPKYYSYRHYFSFYRSLVPEEPLLMPKHLNIIGLRICHKGLRIQVNFSLLLF